MKILIADDHLRFASELKILLEAYGVEVVASVRNGNEAVAAAIQYRPDIVLIDIQLPNCDCLNATCRIKANFPAVRIGLLTMSGDEPLLLETLKNGASGYLLRNLESRELLKLLIELADEKTFFLPGAASRLLQIFPLAPHLSANSAEKKEAASLSQRQKLILDYVARGMTYREVGVELHISEATVKYHMNKLRGRLHLKNRAQAIAYAAKTYLRNAKVLSH